MPPSPSAEALFAEYLDQIEAGDRTNFEEWVTRHPDHEDDLRELHAAYQLLADTPSPDLRLSFFGDRATAGAVPSPGLFPGKRIGDFVLDLPIGDGGMGQVWKARQVPLDRDVALKFLRPERVNEKGLEYFAREARAAGRLTHPAIVTVHGFGEDDGVAWISMELVEGSWTLRDLLDDTARRPSVPADYDERVARFVAEIANALQSAHDVGVIHRDLKPRNVLITREEQPKLTDFGLARITDEAALSLTGDFAGTYYYMSPEQVAGKRMGLDHRTDVFSLGVVMYEMLTLRRPFQGDTPHLVAQQIVLREPPAMRSLRSRIPRDLEVICGKAIEKDPEKRYATMAAFAEDIRRHLADEPIHAKPPTRLDRIVKAARRNRAMATATCVAAVAFIVISVLALFIYRQNEELTTSNTAAEVATQVARKRAQEAKDTAERERRRADEVLRLSLDRDHDELVAQAATLWPARPENIAALQAWVDQAQGLLDEIPTLVESRDALRALALAQTEEERLSDRARHPALPQFVRLEKELESKRRALAEREHGKRDPVPRLDWTSYPTHAYGLLQVGKVLDGDLSKVAMLELAYELSNEQERSEICSALADVYLRLGRDEDALEHVNLAFDYAAAHERDQKAAAVATMEAAVDAATSAEGFERAQAEIDALETRVSELEGQVQERVTWRFSPEVEATTRAGWWHGQLSELVERLRSLTAPGTGLASPDGIHPEQGWSVPRRLAFARRLEVQLAPGGELAERWASELPAIRADYPGVELATQPNLLPIGKDPASGFWEFWHIESGREPTRTSGGELAMAVDSGLVFVLLPGGTFWMGAQSHDPLGRNYDPGATWNEALHDVELSPFFVSKYEMSQGQWRQLTGTDPSGYRETYHPKGGRRHSDLHPVEQIDWTTARLVLARHGLRLPTEAEWEYGARGGTSTPWWTGTDHESLWVQNAANVRDRAHAVWSSTPEDFTWTHDDGYGPHAPVDAFAPNPFGLHNVTGNVAEWCEDTYSGYFFHWSPKRDPVHTILEDNRVVRGTSYLATADLARIARRAPLMFSAAGTTIGVRPAMSLSD